MDINYQVIGTVLGNISLLTSLLLSLWATSASKGPSFAEGLAPQFVAILTAHLMAFSIFEPLSDASQALYSSSAICTLCFGLSALTAFRLSSWGHGIKSDQPSEGVVGVWTLISFVALSFLAAASDIADSTSATPVESLLKAAPSSTFLLAIALSFLGCSVFQCLIQTGVQVWDPYNKSAVRLFCLEVVLLLLYLTLPMLLLLNKYGVEGKLVLEFVHGSYCKMISSSTSALTLPWKISLLSCSIFFLCATNSRVLVNTTRLPLENDGSFVNSIWAALCGNPSNDLYGLPVRDANSDEGEESDSQEEAQWEVRAASDRED
jgi:hypothetical protein